MNFTLYAFLVVLTITGIAYKPSQKVTESKQYLAQPNIILYLADDMGWGDAGCYGQTKILTPNLDQMAENGIRFTDAYCGSPVCAPSRSTLMIWTK